MPRVVARPVDLAGLVLPDARRAASVDLGALAGPAVVVAVRHRH